MPDGSRLFCESQKMFDLPLAKDLTVYPAEGCRTSAARVALPASEKPLQDCCEVGRGVWFTLYNWGNGDVLAQQNQAQILDDLSAKMAVSLADEPLGFERRNDAG
jgi:hypothetical protein